MPYMPLPDGVGSTTAGLQYGDGRVVIIQINASAEVLRAHQLPRFYACLALVAHVTLIAHVTMVMWDQNGKLTNRMSPTLVVMRGQSGSRKLKKSVG